MPPAFRLLALLLLLPAGMVGCRSVVDGGDLTSDSLLQVARTSPDAVTLDIYWARADLTDAETIEQLWSSVQEDRVPLTCRRALAENGLRVGVVGGNPSAEVLRLLNPSGTNAPPKPGEESSLADVVSPKVKRRLLQLRSGKRAEIQVSDTSSTMRLLRQSEGQLSGNTYSDARGMYALEVIRSGENQVELQLTPELHHGQPRMQYTPSGPGMVVQRLARDVEVFGDLRTNVTLAPGEMLLVTSLPKAGLRLGGLFHRVATSPGGSSAPEQKVLLIRLSQVPEPAALAQSTDTAWPWR